MENQCSDVISASQNEIWTVSISIVRLKGNRGNVSFAAFSAGVFLAVNSPIMR